MRWIIKKILSSLTQWNPIMRWSEGVISDFLSRLQDKIHLAGIPIYKKGPGIKLSHARTCPAFIPRTEVDPTTTPTPTMKNNK